MQQNVKPVRVMVTITAAMLSSAKMLRQLVCCLVILSPVFAVVERLAVIAFDEVRN